MNDLHMELKVCEGCGTLWVRAGAPAGVYCRGCAARLAEFPSRRRLRAYRPRVYAHPSTTARIACRAGGAR